LLKRFAGPLRGHGRGERFGRTSFWEGEKDANFARPARDRAATWKNKHRWNAKERQKNRQPVALGGLVSPLGGKKGRSPCSMKGEKKGKGKRKARGGEANGRGVLGSFSLARGEEEKKPYRQIGKKKGVQPGM